MRFCLRVRPPAGRYAVKKAQNGGKIPAARKREAGMKNGEAGRRAPFASRYLAAPQQPRPLLRVTIKSWALVMMPLAARLPRSLSLFTVNSEISTQ